MAATLADSAALAVDPVFLGKVQAAFCAYGAQLVSTTPYDPTLPSTLPMRSLYITPVSQGMDNYVTAMAWTVAAQSDITSDSTDADIAAAVQTLWPAVAGVSPQ